MSHIINHEWRAVTFVAAIAVVIFGRLFLSNAFARQKRVSPGSELVEVRAPIGTTGGFTFAVPFES